MSVEAPWMVRAALHLVPRTWRSSVQQDLIDESVRTWWGWCRCACAAIGIAIALHWMFTRATLMSDIRYAIRSIVRARAFALGAIATFALGISVNVAVFSAVDRMLFRPLPYAQPDELVVMGEFSVGESDAVRNRDSERSGPGPSTTGDRRCLGVVLESRQVPAGTITGRSEVLQLRPGLSQHARCPGCAASPRARFQ